MSEETVAERRPGLIISVCGLAFASLTLAVVHWLNEFDFNAMGFYVEGILPVGALAVGAVSGLGFAFSARFLQVRLGNDYLLWMVLAGFLTYWGAQYSGYARLMERLPAAAEYGFGEYVRDTCEQMAFKPDNKNERPKPLGGWGYLLKFLEMIGFVAGAVIPAGIISDLPYCRACQKYLKAHRKGYLNSPEPWANIKPLAKQIRTERLNQVLVALEPSIRQSLELLVRANFANVDQFVAGLTPADKGAAARVKFTLEKCPMCEAHRLTVTLECRTIDKKTATKTLAQLDRLEPAATATRG